MAKDIVPPCLHSNTGNLWLDVLPLLTMVAPTFTLALLYRVRDFETLVVYSYAFWVAIGYHLCTLQEGGLLASTLLNVSGVTWRKVDICTANVVFVRLLADMLGARTWKARFVPNYVYPLALTSLMASSGRFTLKLSAPLTMATCVVTVLGKLWAEGWRNLPPYEWARDRNTIGVLIAAFAAFPMPSYRPDEYWLWHSMWHALLGVFFARFYRMSRSHLLPDKAAAAGNDD